MKTTIKLMEGKTSRGINVLEFEKNARIIFTKDVRVQIKKARSAEQASNAVLLTNGTLPIL